MEREQMKEIIKRNREALGIYSGTSLSEVAIACLVAVNKTISLETIIKGNEYEGIEYELADGLIVSYSN